MYFLLAKHSKDLLQNNSDNQEDVESDFINGSEEFFDDIDDGIAVDEEPLVDDKPVGELTVVELVDNSQFINSILDKAGREENSIIIDGSIRLLINDFCNSNVFGMMPDTKNCEFERIEDAIIYIFSLYAEKEGKYPIELSEDVIESGIKTTFGNAYSGCKEFKHQSYGQFVLYEEGLYSLVPFGIDCITRTYNTTSFSIEKNGEGILISLLMDEYLFDPAGNYEPCENDIELEAQASILGKELEDTISYILVNDQFDNYIPNRQIEVEIYIDSNKNLRILRFVDKIF